MREGESSNTALRAAVQRAAHQLFDAPLIFADPLAARIVGAEEEAAMRAAGAAEYHTPFALPFRAAVVARSRMSEDLVKAATGRGVRQVVQLGAGLDTLGYRSVLPTEVRVYEVDHPATQAWKKQKLAAAEIEVPGSVTFVPVDFDNTHLEQGLRAANIDFERRAFFSWLGVTYYLSSETVEEVLRYIGSLASGSELVFDYFEAVENHGAAKEPGFQELRTQVAAVGEPWKSHFAPQEMAAKLASAGFSEIEDIDSTGMAARYFAGRNDGLAPTGPIRFVRAVAGKR